MIIKNKKNENNAAKYLIIRLRYATPLKQIPCSVEDKRSSEHVTESLF